MALFAPLLRPAATRAIKGGIYVGRHAKKVASTLKEEFEDMVGRRRIGSAKSTSDVAARTVEGRLTPVR
jgi:hypothetical protein